MILGAGPNQLTGIKKAVNLGFNVITVDNIPDSIGHKYSHQYVNCSTVDKKGILKAASELDIDGIVTFASDVAIPTVGYVAEQLGLTGPGHSVAETMANKTGFRVFQRENRLNHPNFAIAERREDLERQISNLMPPLMFKPVDTSGSRGISIVSKPDPESCSLAFEYAKGYSRSKTVCVEQYVEGIDVSGDGFLSDGRFTFAVITKKYKRDFVVTGHRIPTAISAADQNRVIAEVTKTCTAIGYMDGPLDFDVRISKDQVTVLELSPRLGGNGIPMIVERGTGVDLFSAAIQLSLGYKIKLPEKAEISRSCGAIIFGSDTEGILKHLAADQEIMDAVPEIFEYHLSFKIGDQVPIFTHGGNSLGYAIFDCPPQLTYSSIVARIKNTLQIGVSKKSSNHNQGRAN
jgi:formate-dependent phosphoribosylglycinamide formyltransferase (GAR transformylase)